MYEEESLKTIYEKPHTLVQKPWSPKVFNPFSLLQLQGLHVFNCVRSIEMPAMQQSAVSMASAFG